MIKLKKVGCVFIFVRGLQFRISIFCRAWWVWLYSFLARLLQLLGKFFKRFFVGLLAKLSPSCTCDIGNDQRLIY